jgi:hypothetical protein
MHLNMSVIGVCVCVLRSRPIKVSIRERDTESGVVGYQVPISEDEFRGLCLESREQGPPTLSTLNPKAASGIAVACSPSP